MYEQEFVLYEAYSPKNLLFPRSAYETFSLVNKDPAESRGIFSEGYSLLVDVLGIPPMFNAGIEQFATEPEFPRGHGLNAYQP